MSWRSILPLAGVLAPIALAASCGDDGSEESSANFDQPVITPHKTWSYYPLAEVVGRLELENGCPVIDGHVVYWPKGVEWDGDTQSVMSDGEVWATVGKVFEGGGGWHERTTDYRELLGEQPDEAVKACLDATGAVGSVFAHGD